MNERAGHRLHLQNYFVKLFCKTILNEVQNAPNPELGNTSIS